MSGLRRLATNAAMYKTARTGARPPQMVRLPAHVPLSRFNGATPTRAAISWRLSRPSSGRSASRVVATTGPTPGTLVSNCWSSRQTGLRLICSARVRSMLFSWRRSQPRCAWIFGRTAGGAACRRVCSAVRISTSWRAGPRPGLKSLGGAAGHGREGGPNRGGEVAQHRGGEGVGLGELARRPPEVADLAGVDDDPRKAGPEQRGYHSRLEASRGLEHD